MSDHVKFLLIGLALGVGLNVAGVVANWKLGVELSNQTYELGVAERQRDMCDDREEHHYGMISNLTRANKILSGCLYHIDTVYYGPSGEGTWEAGSWVCPEDEE